MIQKISSKKNVTFISIPTFYGTYQIIFSEVQNLLKLTESTGFWPKRAKNLLKLTELTESTIPSCLSPKHGRWARDFRDFLGRPCRRAQKGVGHKMISLGDKERGRKEAKIKGNKKKTFEK